MLRHLSPPKYYANVRRWFKLSYVFKPCEYRRRSAEGYAFGYATNFEKKVYLAIPSTIRNVTKSQPKEYSVDSQAELKQQQEKLVKKQYSLRRLTLSRDAKRRLNELNGVVKPMAKALRPTDKGYFIPPKLTLEEREQHWVYKIDMKLIKAREAAFGFKVSKVADDALSRQKKPEKSSRRGSAQTNHF